MRLLVLGLAVPDDLCRDLAAELDVTAFSARQVDLGDFGKVRAPADFDAPYRFRSGRVFPVRPYPYSRWLSGLHATIRQAAPEVALYVGEPSELAAAQSLLAVRRIAPKTRVGVYVFENITQHWHGRLRWLRGNAEKAVTKQLDFAACASYGAVKRLAALGLPEERCRVVYPQIDSDLFRRTDAAGIRTAHNLDGRIVVGYAGRIVWEKGLDTLVNAVAALPGNYTALLLGSGRYAQALHGLIGELGVAERIVHVPAVAVEEVPRYLSAMDMLVLPSCSIATWQEQYGRVLPQAMLCEVPVIGSDSGAIPEIIGDAGVIFRESDVEGLTEAIRRLGDDHELRSSLAETGLERARRTFVGTYSTVMLEWLQDAAGMPLRGG